MISAHVIDMFRDGDALALLLLRSTGTSAL